MLGRGEGELRGSETRGRSTGRQTHAPAPRAALGSPAPCRGSEQPPGTCPRPSSESVVMLSKGREPARCPAAWIQSLRITNAAANNSQQAPGPQACAPQPRHAACTVTTHRPWILEPPHCSLPHTGTGSRPGREPPTQGAQAPWWSVCPTRAGQEQSELFPRMLGRSFIFKQDLVPQEDLPGIYRHCSPPLLSQGSALEASVLQGLGGRGKAAPSPEAGRTASLAREHFATNLQTEDADGKNEHQHPAAPG